MRDRKQTIRQCVAATLFMFCAGQGSARDAAPAPGKNVADMKFATFPGMPACSIGSVQNGDPAKGASIVMAKMNAGCVFPWHWHTPNEHVMMVSGVARAEMKDAAPVMLRAGGFMLMPSHHVHRFTCVKSCSLFVYSDAAFDMHYVDGAGQEIPPDKALSKEALPRSTKAH